MVKKHFLFIKFVESDACSVGFSVRKSVKSDFKNWSRIKYSVRPRGSCRRANFRMSWRYHTRERLQIEDTKLFLSYRRNSGQKNYFSPNNSRNI